MFFGCASYELEYAQTPQEINDLSFAPMKQSKIKNIKGKLNIKGQDEKERAYNYLMSPPKKGNAKLAIYKRYSFAGGGADHVIYGKYNPPKDLKLLSPDMPIISKDNMDIFLCFLAGSSTCVVEIKANKAMYLDSFLHISGSGWTVAGFSFLLAILPGVLQVSANATSNHKSHLDEAHKIIFYPKPNQIYCAELAGSKMRELIFRDKEICIENFQDIYEDDHIEKQDEYFQDLLEDSDPKAYKE